jgi:hypothetical protein
MFYAASASSPGGGRGCLGAEMKAEWEPEVAPRNFASLFYSESPASGSSLHGFSTGARAFR